MDNKNYVELNAEKRRIVRTPAADLKTEQELFRKYELGFEELRTDEMVDAKKEWHRRNPGKKFHPAYAKRVNEFWN